LRPALSSLHFLERKIDPVLLEMDLNNQGNSLQIPLMLRQNRQRLLAPALSLQHRSPQNLHRGILRIIFRQFLRQLERSLGIARRELRQRLHRSEIGVLFFALDGGQDFGGLAEGELGAELQDAGGKVVVW
jgi:hypothetical protein